MAGFRPGRGPTVLTMVAVAAFCALGIWQLYRNEWRERDLAMKAARTELPEVSVEEALNEPASYAFRRVTARGRFEQGDTIIVGPVERGPELGARVLTPLLLESQSASGDTAARVLVDRGWIPQTDIERFLPPDVGPEPGAGLGETVAVRGLALELATRDAEPGPRDKRHTHFSRFNPDRPGLVKGISTQLPYALAPVMVQAADSEPGGLPIGDVARPVSPVNHLGYAMTWFSVGALSLVAWVEYGRRRAQEESERAARLRAVRPSQ
jgi:surfeit locus 1 family protein